MSRSCVFSERNGSLWAAVDGWAFGDIDGGCIWIETSICGWQPNDFRAVYRRSIIMLRGSGFVAGCRVSFDGFSNRITRSWERGWTKVAQWNRYAKMPLFWGLSATFVYRYIIKLGFWSGVKVWSSALLAVGGKSCVLADAKIFEIKRACGNDIKRYANIWKIIMAYLWSNIDL